MYFISQQAQPISSSPYARIPTFLTSRRKKIVNLFDFWSSSNLKDTVVLSLRHAIHKARSFLHSSLNHRIIYTFYTVHLHFFLGTAVVDCAWERLWGKTVLWHVDESPYSA